MGKKILQTKRDDGKQPTHLTVVYAYIGYSVITGRKIKIGKESGTAV